MLTLDAVENRQAFRQFAHPARLRLPSKRTNDAINELARSTGTLYTEVIPLPNQGVAPSQRERNVIFMSGIKKCIEIINIGGYSMLTCDTSGCYCM